MPADGAVLTGALPQRIAPPRPTTIAPAPLARMLALAIHLRDAVESGQIPSYTAAASALGVSRQRISVLVRLTFLAPDIQEQILALTSREVAVSERDVFERVARELSWQDQRAAWRRLRECEATQRAEGAASE